MLKNLDPAKLSLFIIVERRAAMLLADSGFFGDVGRGPVEAAAPLEMGGA